MNILLKFINPIIENNTDAVYILSVDGIIEEVNPVLTRLFGYTKEEMKGIHYKTLVVPAYFDITNHYFLQSLQGTSCEYETQVFKKSGDVLSILVKNIPLIANGKILGIFGVAIDNTANSKMKAVTTITNPSLLAENKEFQMTDKLLVATVNFDRSVTTIANVGEKDAESLIKENTDKKKLEQELKESQKIIADLNRALNVSSSLAITDQKGIIQYANDIFCSLSKYSREELIGQNHRITNSGYHSKEFFRNMWKTISKGEIWKGEIRNKAKDGSIYWVYSTIVPFLDNDGKPYQYAAIRNDITEKKQAEEALKQSEEKFRLITEHMTDLIGILDENGRVQYASPSHEPLLGLPPEVYEGNLAFDVVHQDDVMYLRQQFDHMVASRENINTESRFRHVNGNWVWMEVQGRPVFDEEGNLHHFLVVARDITERKLYEKKLTEIAYRDPITNLPNRRMFYEQIDYALKMAKLYNKKMAVFYMDIDKFKEINDTFGHDVGDELLIEFAKRVNGCLRNSDMLARLGGDEFILLLQEIQETKNAIKFAERILTSIQEPWEIGLNVINITSSIGIAIYPDDGTDAVELIKNADRALYHVKRNGRNNFKTYSYPME